MTKEEMIREWKAAKEKAEKELGKEGVELLKKLVRIVTKEE
jgi:hypothetical protein